MASTRSTSSKGKSGPTQSDNETEISITANPDLTSTLLQLVVKVTEVLSKNADLQEQLRDLKESNACLTKRIEELENKTGDWTVVSKHQTAPLSDVNAMTCTVADEIQARQEKELNLVIMGLDEGPGNNNLSESEEKDRIRELLGNIDVHTPNISRAFRMGKRNPHRPRPLKVFCGNSTTRASILTNAKKLKNLSNDHRHKRVFIRPDLTKMQRDQDYLRRQEKRNQLNNHQNKSNERSSRGNDERPDRDISST